MEVPAGRPQRLDYIQARRLLLAVGIAILGLIALYSYYRRVDTTEVIATLLFIPVFVALVLWDLKGGLAAGAAASLVYLAIRLPALRAVAEPWFTGTVAARSAMFLAFGAIGGWASRQMTASLTKLELYDQIDDATGLHNARFFLQETNVQIARAKRYQALFSVVSLDIPAAPIAALSPRRKAATLRGLGRLLGRSVRVMDRVAHAHEGPRHVIAAILPDTGAEGAGIFVRRLAEGVARFLAMQGAAVAPGAILTAVMTYPEDEAALDALRARMSAVDRAEHPPLPAEGGGRGA